MRDLWDQRLGVWWIGQDHPERLAVIDTPTGRTLTYGELTALAHRAANALRASGLRDGDIVAYALPNDVEALVVQLATSEVGMRYLSLSPALSGDEVSALLAHAGARAVIVHADYLEQFAYPALTTALALRVVVGHAAADHDAFVEFNDLCAAHPPTPPGDRRLGEGARYSSGTTGKPKGIVVPLTERDPWQAAHEATLFARAFDFVPFDGAHLVSAAMHHGGCQGFYLAALNVGQGLVIMGKFDAEQALALIEKHPVTTAYMVPTQFVRMLKLPLAVRNRYDVSSLKVVVHSAAPCPVEVKRAIMEWWGPIVWETYGGTEGAATIAKPHRWLEKPGTVGRTIRGMRVRIIDDEGNELGPNLIGNVYLERDDGERFEYRGDAELTASVFKGASFTIGDIGYLDDDGYLFICDRAKDMVISGGVNIYPAEVESVLSGHPAVADVAVIGIPDSVWGEQIKAVIELVEGPTPSQELAAELIAYCRGRLAGFKCPRSIDFDQALPRTEAGKLLKRQLRERYWAAAGRQI